MKKVAIYIRVSTQEQALHGYSIGEQRERLVAFCKAHDWLVGEVFVDSGYSGANLDRPGIQQLKDRVSDFNLVLVYKLDRLSRSQRDTLYLIEEVFLPAKVDFVSISESFDTSTPFGRAMIGILSVFAQLEREQIKERTHMGAIARAKKGLWHGSGNPPVGYDYVNDMLVINEYEAEQVRECFRLFIEGNSPHRIAEIMTEKGYTTKAKYIWSETSMGNGVRRILQNDVYIGTNRYGETVVENCFEPIIDLETWEKAQDILKKRHKNSAPYHSTSLLTSMVYCARCGARYFSNYKSGGTKTNVYEYHYYICYSRRYPKCSCATARTCDNKAWRREKLDAYVEGEVRSLLFDPKYCAKILKSPKKAAKKKPNTEASSLQKKISDLERKISRTMELYENESIPADLLASRIDGFYREKVALTEKLNSLVQPAPKRDYNSEGIAALLADFALVWDSASMDEKREILFALIDRIVIDGENVTIEWSF